LNITGLVISGIFGRSAAGAASAADSRRGQNQLMANVLSGDAEPRTQRSGVSGLPTAYSAALRVRLGLSLGNVCIDTPPAAPPHAPNPVESLRPPPSFAPAFPRPPLPGERQTGPFGFYGGRRRSIKPPDK